MKGKGIADLSMARWPTAVLLLLLVVSPGCVTSPDQTLDGGGADDGDAGDHGDPIAPRDQEPPFPELVLSIHDLRSDPRDPEEPLVLDARIAYRPTDATGANRTIHLTLTIPTAAPDHLDLAEPPSWNTTLRTTADADDGNDKTDDTDDTDDTPDDDTVHLNHTFRPETDAGNHTVTLTAVWDDDHPGHDHSGLQTQTNASFIRYAPLTLHLDAHHAWYDDQKTFDTTYTVGVAPWDSESGLDVLDRARRIHDFAVTTTYREDLDSYYLIAVNGTKERWETIGPATTGTSWSWMVWLDGEQSDRALDDTRPGQDALLALRYLECDSTGSCKEPPA